MWYTCWFQCKPLDCLDCHIHDPSCWSPQGSTCHPPQLQRALQSHPTNHTGETVKHLNFACKIFVYIQTLPNFNVHNSLKSWQCLTLPPSPIPPKFARKLCACKILQYPLLSLYMKWFRFRKYKMYELTTHVSAGVWTDNSPAHSMLSVNVRPSRLSNLSHVCVLNMGTSAVCNLLGYS